MDLRISNYRNFSENRPVSFSVEPGITFFLGVNNIGKSNLLKFFYEMREVLEVVSRNGSLGRSQIKAKIPFDEILNRKSLESGENFINIQLFKEESKNTIDVAPWGSVSSDEFAIHSNEIIGEGTSYFDFRKMARELSDTLYIGAARNGIFEASGQLFDIEIGHRFINLWNEWAGGKVVSHRNKIDALIEELRELFGFKKFNIKVDNNKSNLLITTDDGTFRLDELGGGISQFIIVLGNALIKNPGFILIDEPEISLHPKLQEVFVRALASKAKYGLIASSHSIGLARSVADHIFSVTKNPSGELGVDPFGQHYKQTIAQSINELGYSQFVEIGGNSILLVEGRTDVKSFREILRKFGLDNKFIVVPLGGTQFIIKDTSRIIDELNEIKRLNPKMIAVIFDSEKSSMEMPLDGKLQSFKETCEELGFEIFPTEYHSTENYISQTAINNIVGNTYKALTSFENFTSRPAAQKWDKEKNWLMFREMEKGDFENTELGKFIVKKLSV